MKENKLKHLSYLRKQNIYSAKNIILQNVQMFLGAEFHS